MTREEAILLLHDIKDTYNEIYENYEIGYEQMTALDMAIEALSERPKGEWIKKQVFNPELDEYIPLIECSVCGYEPYYGGSEPKFNYCAYCGADMRGEQNG